MGSGKKFRITLAHPGHWGLGAFLGIRSEHEVSVHIELIKINIYIGFGKGYEEFDK